MEVCSDPDPELWKWESWPHYSFLKWWYVWRRDAPSTSSSPETGGRAGPHVIDLPLISYSAQENDHYTLPGQHSRAVPKGIGVGEPTLRTWKWENWLHLLLTAARDELAMAVLESSHWWWRKERVERFSWKWSAIGVWKVSFRLRAVGSPGQTVARELFKESPSEGPELMV